MVSLKQMIARAAPQQSWVLLQGEHGSGKQLVAQNIHYLSPRASRPFIEVNCSAIPEDLIDSELFGFEKGAFAGADKTKKGKLESAQGGTVFVDDIADLSLDAQQKLLRILQEKKFQRMGGSQFIDIDIRLIASTGKDLEAEVQAGKFSEDLYHRINVVTFKVPSLREHGEDIPVLIEHFSDQIAKDAGFAKKDFSIQAVQLMRAHTWPGNVRELKNFIERVYILTPEDTIDVHDLRFAGLASGAGTSQSELPTFREARAKFEKEYLLKKIQENNGNISRTAEVIGLERSYLHRKIKAFGIEVSKGNEEF